MGKQWKQWLILFSRAPKSLKMVIVAMKLKDAYSLEEKAMAPYSSTLAWKIPWMEEPGRLQSMRSLRVGHDWATSLSLFTFMHWKRKWQPTPVFLPGESQGQGSLVGCRLWGRTRVRHDRSDLAVLLGRKVMTNLDSTLKSRDITLSTKVHLVKAMVFPVVMYGCESWTI